MIWLRFIFIALLKWIAQFVFISIFLRYIMPPSWVGYQISAPIWLVAFSLAFAFATWAFTKILPGKREVVYLLLVWIVVTASLYIFQSYYFFGTVLPFLNSFEVYIQYGFEIFAIIVAAYLVRRRKIKAALAEGLLE